MSAKLSSLGAGAAAYLNAAVGEKYSLPAKKRSRSVRRSRVVYTRLPSEQLETFIQGQQRAVVFVQKVVDGVVVIEAV